MDVKQLRKKRIEELRELAKETKSKLSQQRAAFIQDKESDLSKIRNLKKDCARILTVLNEKRRKKNA